MGGMVSFNYPPASSDMVTSQPPSHLSDSGWIADTTYFHEDIMDTHNIDEQVRKDFESGFVTRRLKERYNDKMGEDEKKEEGRRVYQLMAYNMAVDGIDGRTDR